MNDNYQKHVVSSMIALEPDIVVVLGDIFSFQHLSPEEFARRLARFNWILESGSFPPPPPLNNTHRSQ